jgi:hypothetical protein
LRASGSVVEGCNSAILRRDAGWCLGLPKCILAAASHNYIKKDAML